MAEASTIPSSLTWRRLRDAMVAGVMRVAPVEELELAKSQPN